MAEYQLKEALQVLLDADQLLPTRTRLEQERPVSEEDVILHEALLSLRGEFEALWPRANAVYDRLIPHLNLNQAAVADWSDEERLEVEEMNEALEASTEPAPGSWQGIRGLLLEMEAEGQIDLDMELTSYSDYAWTRVYWSVQYYTGRGRSSFRIWLERSGRYRELVERILVEEGLPRDMVFLCMIESGFSPRAYSRVAATGPWQFMYYTAQKFGLKTYRNDKFLDQRRDYEHATRAASQYLTDLYAEFKSWPLAMAAYNSGEGRVRSAQRWARSRNRTQDYWTIYNRLPRETKNYVPYYLAAIAITKNLERFGFTDIAYQAPFEGNNETVHVEGSLSLKQVAEMIGATESVVWELNAEINPTYKVTPPEGYDLRLPVGTTDAFVAALEQLPLEGRKSYLQHVVRRGETGSVIAEKHGVAWSAIRSENGIRNDRNLQVGQTLQIPRREKSRYLTEAEIESLTRSRTVVASGTPIRIRVQRGDTVSGLATRYGVTWVQIRQWNSLRGNTIYAGQSLTIYPRRNSSVARAAVATASLPATGVYTIGRNDTLWDISQKFRVSVSDLKQWNGLRGNTIYPGQKLIVTRAAALAAGTGGGGGPGGS
jgi:membrane-bound lytic murein transglycosylase D